MKGFKLLDMNGTSSDILYEVGKKEYAAKELLKVSTYFAGFDFYKNIVDCYNYCCFDSSCKIVEVEALGGVTKKGDKCYTDKIKIVRELSLEEVLDSANLEHNNYGYGNSGRNNKGDTNTGYVNHGRRNSGDFNYYSHNTGSNNVGYLNSGNDNGGNRNTGRGNKGNNCSGDYNIADDSSGVFCTEKRGIRIFDVETNITLTKWRCSKAYILLMDDRLNRTEFIRSKDMTDEEKEENPEHIYVGGYLKEKDIKKGYKEWWKSLLENEKSIIKAIPNFDAKKFKKITGIEVNKVYKISNKE